MTVATLVVQQFTGATPTKTTVTTPRLSTSDSSNPGTSNPIPIPASSYNYSYWMSLHLTITAMNSATLLNNHKFYSDGGTGSWTLGTNGQVRVGKRDSGDNGVPVASYQIAAGTTGTTGYDMADGTNGHAYYKGQGTPTGNVADYLSGAKLTVDTGDHTTAEGFKGVVLQAKVAPSATRGAQAAATLTFEYDEI